MSDEIESPAATDAPPPSVDQVTLTLRKVKDPELNLSIVDLGLVYDVMVDGPDVTIDMTLTDQSRLAALLVAGTHRAARSRLHGLVVAVGRVVVGARSARSRRRLRRRRNGSTAAMIGQRL